MDFKITKSQGYILLCNIVNDRIWMMILCHLKYKRVETSIKLQRKHRKHGSKPGVVCHNDTYTLLFCNDS